MVGDLFFGASGVWHTIGTHINRHVYIVRDLGELEAAEKSVLYLNSDEAKPSEDVIRQGARETPDPEEHMYMDPVPPREANGYH